MSGQGAFECRDAPAHALVAPAAKRRRGADQGRAIREREPRGIREVRSQQDGAFLGFGLANALGGQGEDLEAFPT